MNPLRISFLYVLLCIFLAACKSGSARVEEKETAGEEEWHITDEIKQVQIGPAEEDAFRQAALDGQLETLKELHKLGVGCDVIDQDGHTALMLAAFNGHSEIVLYLLDSGAQIDGRDYANRTALHYASTGPFPETVQILLDRGADPNVVDSEEHFSPLMHAAAEGNLDVVKVLIAKGADKSMKDIDGDDAATFSAQNGHMQVVEYLNSL